MNPLILWYQCIHPKYPNHYFYNIKTNEVKWHLKIAERDEDNVQYLQSIGYYGDNDIIYYISFWSGLLARTLIFHFANVVASFRASKENELSVRKGDVVIILTTNLSGWCYAQNIHGDKGYIPFAYTSPLLPSKAYVPEWQEVLTIRPATRMHYSVRKELISAQRKSRLYAQNSKSYIQLR